MEVLTTSWEGVDYVSAVTAEAERDRRLVEATYLRTVTQDRIEIDGTVSFTVVGFPHRRLRYRQSIRVPDGKVPEITDPRLCFDAIAGSIVSVYEERVGFDSTKIQTIYWTADLYDVADINRDGWVDGADLGLLYADWGLDVVRSDLNRDGVVDGADLGRILVQWDG